MATPEINFTKAAIADLPPAAPGKRDYYRDARTPGLILQITASGTKSFLVYKWAGKKPVRVTLGQFPDTTIEQARKRAAKDLGKIADGKNPNDEKKAKRVRSITLLEVFKDFLAARKGLKPRTVYDYERLMGLHAEEDRTDPTRARKTPRKSPGYFKDWQDKPIAEITKDMIERKHRELGATSEAQANLAMRFLRALFYFAMAKYENSHGKSLISENPVKRLSETRSWYRVERRGTLIKTHELKPWFTAVQALKAERPDDKAEVVKDYLVFIALTGLRRQEAARLRWMDVDLKAKTFTVFDTKNREPHSLPLSDYLVALLERRKKDCGTSSYVFPGDSRAGHIVEPRRQIERVVKASEVNFGLHDLRRTFITIAESLDIPAYALKRLLNHKMANDVTAGYIVADVERLREPMQKITDFVLRAAGVKKSAEVVSMDKRRRAK